jgi:hypothetical protein
MAGRSFRSLLDDYHDLGVVIFIGFILLFATLILVSALLYGTSDFHRRGRDYEEKSDYEKAVADYSEAVQLERERFVFLTRNIQSLELFLNRPV